jgi:hypothetical protein
VYRCEATSVEGFVQQLAVSYVGRGYLFYVAGSVPEHKEPREVDRKIIQKYEIDSSKWTRFRRRRLGFASVQYIRFARFFILIASQGLHRFFDEERIIHDVRRRPIRFAGYSVSLKLGRDGRWHPSVRIEAVEFYFLKRSFLQMALTCNFDLLAARFAGLHFVPYAPIRQQYSTLLRLVNRVRGKAGLETLPKQVLPLRRRPVRPFG